MSSGGAREGVWWHFFGGRGGCPVTLWGWHFPPARPLVPWGSLGLGMLVFSGSGPLSFLLSWQQAGSRLSAASPTLHSRNKNQAAYAFHRREAAEQTHWKSQRPEMLRCGRREKRMFGCEAALLKCRSWGVAKEYYLHLFVFFPLLTKSSFYLQLNILQASWSSLVCLWW